MGAGDVKLITAVAAIAGMPLVPWLLILTALAGGVMAVGLALVRGKLKDTILNVGAIALHHRMEGLAPHPQLNVANTRTLRLPYALPIAVGMATTLLLTAFQRGPDMGRRLVLTLVVALVISGLFTFWLSRRVAHASRPPV